MSAPTFFSTDVAQIQADLKTAFETAAGHTLYPAQPEQALLNVLAYRELLLRQQLQATCEQLLVPYSTGTALETLGALVGVPRLPAQPALCTLQVTLQGTEAYEHLIPAGTLVPAKGSAVWFGTAADLRIPAGATTGTVAGVCQTTGLSGNGFAAGEISITNPLSGVASITSTDVSAGGTDIETDDHLRQRIITAPEGFSTCGSRGSYRYHAMAAHNDIVDVAIVSPGGCQVNVYPLLSTGIPGQDVLNLVQAALSAETVRPLCDVVQVLAPARVSYALEVTATYALSADPSALQAAILVAAQAWTADRSLTLGRSLAPSRIIAALWQSGLVDLTVQSPASTAITATQWADCTGITIHMVAASA